MNTRSRSSGRFTVIVSAAIALILVVAATVGWAVNQNRSTAATPADYTSEASEIAAVVQDAMQTSSLQAVIVRVTKGDDVVTEQAFGNSMTGMPATTDMHFRNGAVAFAYISTLLMEYVDAGTVSLDDTIDKWSPELPESNTVTLKMLANQTTGYPDFESDVNWTASYNANPFQVFSYQSRLDYAFDRPMEFAPGTNWSYSHTNFMILGDILSKIGGQPLDVLLQNKVLGPMGLTQTAAYDTGYIPEPVLHAFSSERRVALGIPADTGFYEESTNWNPVWGTPIGAAETTDIRDMTTTAAAIGTGSLLSDASYHAMTDANLIGFGQKLPVCAGACFTLSNLYNYGLGVVRSGPWILQNPLLSGYSATEAYLPSEKVSIAVAVTFAPGAFAADGTYPNSSDSLFRAIGAVVAPDNAPPTKK
ncbi:serine hydrolase domain-containing protein [Subtercola endophyticus]|uniref:serine hydrolase domain-containing protein n=1 Tax=Subtercola endophyticus TaxID=2895559 RepID=UPI001E64ADB0|nr:serine hydrolase domain-containing protein [Subtercola endophyticus]UFS59544.1 beta-lactamase family protein [Subtercola endophyticus]